MAMGDMSQGHIRPADAPAKVASSADPILVEVTRGPMVESRHRVTFAVVDAAGHLLMSAGDYEAQVYGRSAIKPLQALPLLESGAADAFALSEAEIALACASHSGEPRHVGSVSAWLGKIGCDVQDLECGALSDELTARCDHLVKIPTKFCINVGVAGAILMYDRMLCRGAFARRPTNPRGPAEPPPRHVRGRQVIRTRRGA